MPDNLTPRVDLMERLQVQQAQLHDQLIEIAARLGDEHALYADSLALHHVLLALHADALTLQDVRLAQHAEQMAELRAILAAIKDRLLRGNGH